MSVQFPSLLTFTFVLAVTQKNDGRLPLSLSFEGEEEDGPTVESGEGEVETDNFWKKKETFLRGSTVSLGEKISSGRVNNAFPDFLYFPEKISSLISISQPLSVFPICSLYAH